MKTVIVGAGFTGLSAAYDLAKAGHKVMVLEKKSKPGGLAGGFLAENWQWPLEYYYHHVFATDKDIKKLLTELDLVEKLFFKDAETYSLIESKNQKVDKNKTESQTQLKLAKLDSALSLLSFPNLSLFSKLRTGATLAALKLWPFGRFLEKYTAKNFVCATMGEQSWELLWKPLFVGKFGKQADEINAAWFWARIFARSQKLGYFEKGFLGMAEQVVAQLEQIGVEFYFSTEVTNLDKVESSKKVWQVSALSAKESKIKIQADQVLFTGNSKQFLNLTKSQLSKSYINKFKQLESLAATTLVLVLDKPFFKEDIYWLNINCADWPFLALVEHTNFIDNSYYDGSYLLYVGKYLPIDDSLFSFSKEKLLKHYQSYLEKLLPDFKEHLLDYYLFKEEQAQPVVKKNHSQILPVVDTPLPNLYWASMEHIYPYDRGINYAVKLGRDTAQKILNQI